jgi:hypothetical protein
MQADLQAQLAKLAYLDPTARVYEARRRELEREFKATF